MSYRANADDEDVIASYDRRIQRPNGYWFDPGNDDSDRYGGVIDSGFYTIEVTVTDESGASTTRQQTVLPYGPDVDMQTKYTRTVTEDTITVQQQAFARRAIGAVIALIILHEVRNHRRTVRRLPTQE